MINDSIMLAIFMEMPSELVRIISKDFWEQIDVWQTGYQSALCQYCD